MMRVSLRSSNGSAEVMGESGLVDGKDTVEWVDAPEDWIAAKSKSKSRNTSKLRWMMIRWAEFVGRICWGLQHRGICSFWFL